MPENSSLEIFSIRMNSNVNGFIHDASLMNGFPETDQLIGFLVLNITQ